MKRHALVLTLVALIAACKGDEQPKPVSTAPRTKVSIAEKPREVDADNLLNVANGAAVVSRTGELNLELSAAHAIDGLSQSRWSSPPGGASQTLVFSLGAPSRIRSVGLLSPPNTGGLPSTVRFEASDDGKAWREAAVFKPVRSVDPQGIDVQPFEARFVRVSTVETTEYYVGLNSIQLKGEEIAPPATPSVGGCWVINGLAAQLTQTGSRVSGVIATNPPTRVEGGVSGRAVLLMWLREPVWGHAYVTLTPDSERLTGLSFFHHYIPYNLGEAWFGERTACDLPGTPETALPIFSSAGRLRLYGLTFDAEDRLEPSSEPALEQIEKIAGSRPSQRFRISAHELRGKSAEENRAKSERRVTALRSALQQRGLDLRRFEFVAAGDRTANPDILSAMQRHLASCIEIEPVS